MRLTILNYVPKEDNGVEIRYMNSPTIGEVNVRQFFNNSDINEIENLAVVFALLRSLENILGLAHVSDR